MIIICFVIWALTFFAICFSVNANILVFVMGWCVCVRNYCIESFSSSVHCCPLLYTIVCDHTNGHQYKHKKVEISEATWNHSYCIVECWTSTLEFSSIRSYYLLFNLIKILNICICVLYWSNIYEFTYHLWKLNKMKLHFRRTIEIF